MNNKLMKTLTFPDGSLYEVADQEARNKIEELLNNQGNSGNNVMPRWELLNTMTTSEEVASVEFTQDDRGKDYGDDIKRMIVVVNTSYLTSTYNGSLYGSFYFDDNKGFGQGIMCNGVVFAGKSFQGTITIDASGGLPLIHSKNGNIADQPESTIEAPLFNPISIYNRNIQTIHSFVLYGQGGHMIPQYTEIVIFGMRG